jgi:hypothetical protein
VVARNPKLRATDGERVVGGTMAALAAIGFFSLQSDALLWLLIGVAFAGVLAFGTGMGHRGVMAIGFFLCAFGPWSWLLLLGAPYIAAATFLLWRANRLDNTV